MHSVLEQKQDIEIPTSRWHKLLLYFFYFLSGGFCGWIYEMVFFYIVYGYFVNRGFLFGPILPVYGFGAVAQVFLFLPLKEKRPKLGKLPVSPLLCFMASMLVTTAIELITSYLLEWATGGWLWSYASYKINFEGRIALFTSAMFGGLTLFLLYVIVPIFQRLMPFYKRHFKVFSAVGILLLVALLTDFAVHVIALF